jgi:capsular exopolysaccharide synthesis family protein
MAQQNVELHLQDLAAIVMSATVRGRAAEALTNNGVTLNAQELFDSMRVEPLPDSQIISIQFTSKNKDEAVMAAQQIETEFQQYYRSLVVDPTSSSRIFIEKQLKDAESKLRKSREARRNFQTTSGVVALDAQSQVLIQRVAEIEMAAIQASVSAGDAASRIQVISKQLSNEPEMKLNQQSVTDNPIYQKLLDSKVAAETELGTQQATRGRNHPEVQALVKRLAEIDAQIKTQVPKLVSQEVKAVNQVYTQGLVSRLTADADEVGSRARAAALSSALAEKKAELSTLPEDAMKMAQYDLDVRASESTYALLLQKLDEARIREKEAETASAIHVVDPAAVRPEGKKLPIKLTAAVLLSLLLGCSLAFALNYLDTSTKTPAEVEELLGLPVMTVVPLSRSHSLAKRPDNTPLLASYEMLTSMLEGLDGVSKSTVLVASAEPEMGRSTTAANLAITLAQSGSRVILVDADMRKPSLHQQFGASIKPGLCNVLTGLVSVEDAVVPTKIEGLLFMPAGPAPSSPIRLLRSPEMGKFVQQISALADFVVFDSPAGATFADASVLAAYVKHVVIAHAAGKTSQGAESEFRGKLSIVGADIIGVVLNKVRPEDSNGFSHYRRFYEDVSAQDMARSMSGGVRAIPSGKDGRNDS